MKDGFLHIKNYPILIIVNFENLGHQAIEICKKVKSFQIYQRIPIIGVSVPLSQADQLSECRADALLTDPPSEGIFKATVKAWMRVNQADKERSVNQAKVNRLTSLMMKKMQDTQDDLNSAVVSRDLFLSVASHELNTPLSALKMQIQMGQRATHIDTGRTPSPEKLEKIFSVSSRQIDRLTLLVSDLLDVSRIEAGKISYNFEKINLSELVLEISERYIDVARLANSEIEIKIDQNIVGFWDRFRIEQVITNLLSNAIKYGDGGVIQVQLARGENNSALFSVQDEGIGIDQTKIGKIFDRFERAISSTNISGLGLGLYISRTIVEGHQGSISVESEMGKGSKFTVALPIRDRTGDTP